MVNKTFKNVKWLKFKKTVGENNTLVLNELCWKLNVICFSYIKKLFDINFEQVVELFLSEML